MPVALPPLVLANYEPVIGLEVHVQLLTATKAFCSCANRFGSAPNTNICPVCLGLPGALPVLNAKAVEFATLAALAIHCEVRERSIFARKNYFYRELRKRGASSDVAAHVAANTRRWWRNSGMLLHRVLNLRWADELGIPRLC